MEIKLINVYYGQDFLPYKDVERSVHYPITGSAFLGASNTTKIRFYYDYIGDSATTWVSVAKLPNGKQGSQVLSKSSDDNGNYAELELSNWYTQAKGDVYIALQGYSGGVEYSYDDETGLYEINGTPTIQTTGSIKLAINYAPIGDSADYNDEFTTYQQILAGLGDKVDKTDSGNKIYATDPLGGQTTLTYGKDYYDNNAIVQRQSNGQISVPETPVDTYDATSKDYVDSQIATAISSVYKYKGSVATYDNLPTVGMEVGDVYNVEDTGDNYAWTGTTWDKLAGDIDLSDYYTKSDTDTLLSGKQNTLVSGVNIKTINNNSLLGTGNIDIQGGAGTWGTITGDIQDQTDLQAEFQNVREVAEGKANTFVLSYNDTLSSVKSDILINSAKVYDIDGNDITNAVLGGDYDTYFASGYTFANPLFDSQNDSIIVSTDGSGNTFIFRSENKTNRFNSGYIIYYTNGNVFNAFNIGDNFYIIETLDSDNETLPDRWLGSKAGEALFYKLETGKIDLSAYATKSDLTGVNNNIAPTYDSTLTYTKGEVVEYSGKIYRAKQDISTAETWDSTHWSQISVASGFVDLDKAQVITGNKTFDQGSALSFKAEGNYYRFVGDNTWTLGLKVNNNFICRFATSAFYPEENNSIDLGTPYYKWQNGYFGGQVYAQNTFNVINASDIVSDTLTQAQYDLIANGKPTLISGLLGNKENIFIPVFEIYNNIGRGIAIYTYLGSQTFTTIRVSSLQLSFNDTTNKILFNGSSDSIDIMSSIVNVKGKTIPAYPSSTGTFVLKCVDGTLTWVAE